MHIENEILIDASADKVWEAFTDQNLLPEWVCGFKGIKTISGRPLEPGSKHEMTIEERGKDMKFIETVTQVELGKYYAFNVSHASMSSSNAVIISPSDQKTIFHQTMELKPHSLFFRILLPFMKSSIRNNSQKDLEKLKLLIESQE